MATKTFDQSKLAGGGFQRPDAPMSAFAGRVQDMGGDLAVNPLHAHLIDPNNIMWQVMGTRMPAARSLSLSTLREMSRACQPVGAVIHTRQNQVARFAKRPEFRGDLGIRVRMKDTDAKPNKADTKYMRSLEQSVLFSGVQPDPDGEKRPGLDHFLRSIVRDTLTLDAVAIELRDDQKGDLYDWWAIDAATIRPTTPAYKANRAITGTYAASQYGITGRGYGGVAQPANAPIAWVQMINAVPYAEFQADELAYWIRNPRTDLEANGYGYSELEQLIETVTGFLNSMTYNSRYFTHSQVPEGVLGLMGQYTQEQLADFIRYWNSMVSGVQNSHRIPVMAFKDGKGLQWTKLKDTNKDMEFHSWLDFLVTLICAIYQCDREEIGFGAQEAGGPSTMGGQNNEQTLIHSQSKGLFPLMQRLASGFNEDIMPRLDPSGEFEFSFTGLDPDLEDQKIDRAVKFLGAGLKTVNDERAELDLKPIPKEDLWGDAPANAVLFQVWELAQQAKMQSQGITPPGQDDGEDGEPGQAPANPLKGLPKVNEDGTEEDDSEQ